MKAWLIVVLIFSFSVIELKHAGVVIPADAGIFRSNTGTPAFFQEVLHGAAPDSCLRRNDGKPRLHYNLDQNTGFNIEKILS